MPPEEGLYNYGGLSLNNDNGQEVGGLFGIIGRGWNNLSGATANNQFSAQQAQLAYERNALEAQKSRDWEEMMSNTAYQRAVSDMKAAGINPAMAMSNGGASTPTAAGATSNTAAQATRGTTGGLLGMLGKIAMLAIGKGVAAKFGNTAANAAKHGESISKAVSMAEQSEISAIKKMKAMSAADLEKTIRAGQKKYEADYKKGNGQGLQKRWYDANIRRF